MYLFLIDIFLCVREGCEMSTVLFGVLPKVRGWFCIVSFRVVCGFVPLVPPFGIVDGFSPQCPNVPDLLDVLGYPSIFVTFLSTTVASFIFLLVVTLK